MDSYTYHWFCRMIDEMRDNAGDNADVLLAIDNLSAQIEEAHSETAAGVTPGAGEGE